ncbi:alkaline shock response membrane anchor protein AmaP [Symbiobacterium thermophilum]|uniref:Conserved domain protein n=1 Tax=Symbiobacterium thermophilum (strain DSM 24528 / JCM 14929 / IAM 14863 / T) TaxID=292459 RepID=Q67NA7_SYMTH|nr:alkaline shock response membrane anchor protein AmaP [Symbiobacterium thermophilum]BAD40836.1 conserved domain protein [Symbiobacterium thermophilum IAM 14863]
MGIIDRVVLSIYTFSLAIISGLMVLLAIAPEWIPVHIWLQDLLLTGRGRVVLGLVGSAFFVVSVRLIVFAFSSQGGGRPVIYETSMGEVHISLGAVESLVKKTARSVKGVRDMKAVITHAEDGLHAHLTGTVSPEVSIPEVSEEIQSAVRQYVRRVVGVEMAEVRIDIENIATDSRTRRLD